METGKPQNPEKLGFEASPCALIVCSAVEKNRKGQSTIVQKGFTMQTRRDFVKNAATPLILAGIAGTSVVGAANAEEAFEWDEETDVLVVGGGLAGMAAAVTVATEGDGATCLLLEKGASELGDGPGVGDPGPDPQAAVVAVPGGQLRDPGQVEDGLGPAAVVETSARYTPSVSSMAATAPSALTLTTRRMASTVTVART